MTLADLLFDSDRPADELLVHDGADHRRGAVTELAGDLARALADVGVAPHMPVAVMLPNGAGVVAALFGVWRAGAVYLPLNPRTTPTERARVIEKLPPAAVITTPDLRHEAGDLPVVVIDGDRVSSAPGAASAEHLAEGVALVQFTSGTTGEPKAVQLTHGGVLELLDGVIDKLRGGADPSKRPMPNLVPVSMSLWAGIYQVLFACRLGAAIVTMGRFDPVTFRDLIRRFEIRSTVLPPAAMAALADDEQIDDLAPLRYVRSISSPLSPLHARRFRDRYDVGILNCWGQTEIGGEIVGWTVGDWKEHGEDKLGSVGRPHRGVEIRASAPDGSALPTGEEGELCAMTPSLAAGYADGRDFSDRLTEDGWFRTGDIGRVDAEGFVWIDGRVSDMINRGGLKVHPSEVQEVLRLHPSVADAAVVGVPDDRLGEVPWGFVVPESGELDPAALIAHCREHLAAYKVPVEFRAVAELPRNEVGKVLHRDLSALAREEIAG